MRSLLATLRTLVLPGGATSGRRIVLDGVNGLIAIYDANDVLRLRLGSASDNIEMFSGQASEFLAANLQAYPIGSAGAANRRIGLIYESGSFAGRTKSVIDLQSESFDGTIDELINYTAENHNFATAVGDTQVSIIGALDVTGAAPDVKVNSVSMPRGVKLSPTWRFEKTTDTVLSATAGTYTTIISTGNLALLTGRLYRVMAKPGAYIVSAGSGFAAGDTWRWRVHRSVAGGAFSTARIGKAMRPNVAIAAVIPVSDSWTYFALAADANVDFRMEAAKTAGAATVTSTLSVDAGEGYSELAVEDVGAFTAATALH